MKKKPKFYIAVIDTPHCLCGNTNMFFYKKEHAISAAKEAAEWQSQFSSTGYGYTTPQEVDYTHRVILQATIVGEIQHPHEGIPF